jgi:hypothetical protein
MTSFNSSLPSNVEINLVLQKQLLKGFAKMFMVVATFGAIHRAMTHNDNPGRLASINTSKIFFQPLILLIGLVVFV